LIFRLDLDSKGSWKTLHLDVCNPGLEDIVHHTRYKALHTRQSFVTGLGASVPVSEWPVVDPGGTFSYSYFTKHKTEAFVLLAKQTGAGELDHGTVPVTSQAGL